MPHGGSVHGTVMEQLTPLAILSAGNIVGVGILWDGRRQALWWTDIQSSRLHRHCWGRDTQIFPAPERIGSFGLIAGSERLIVAFASGIARYEPLTGAVESLPRSPPLPPGVRFND